MNVVGTAVGEDPVAVGALSPPEELLELVEFELEPSEEAFAARPLLTSTTTTPITAPNMCDIISY